MTSENNQKFDPEVFTDIKSHAADLKSQNSQFVNLCKELEKMYLLSADDLPADEWVKQTISPDPANKLDGAAQLLRATDPAWHVPSDANNTNSQHQASKLENFAASMVAAAGRIRQKPVWYDPVLSGLLYGRAIVTLSSTQEMLAAAKMPLPNNASQLQKLKQQAQIARAQAVADRAPVLFDTVSPKVAFPEFDGLGLGALYTEQQLRVSEVISRWGSDALAQVTGKKLTDQVTVGEWWDTQLHAVYLTGGTAPIFMDEHKWPFVPAGAVEMEGSSNLFYEAGQDAIHPFLYKIDKSGIWKRQNLALTVMSTNLFTIGANPQLLYVSKDPDRKTPMIDLSQPGGIITIEAGEQLGPLALKLIAPELIELMNEINGKAEESTMYSSALGQSLGTNAPFSMVSLLQQAGRLPLTVYQRMLSALFGDLGYKSLQMVRLEGGTRQANSKEGALIEIKSSDIPEQFEIECSFEIAMPQDDRANIATASQATSGPTPLMDLGTAREKYLKLGQSDDIQQRIWSEKFADTQMQMRIQQMVQQQMQQQQMQQQQSMQPGGQMPGAQPGMPAGMPTGGMPQQGNPMTLPPLPGGNGTQPGLPMVGPGEPNGAQPEQLPAMGGQQ